MPPRKKQSDHIPGHPGYCVSRDGRVFSAKLGNAWRELPVKRGHWRRGQPILYALCSERGKRYHLDVIDAIVATFLPPKPPGAILYRRKPGVPWWQSAHADNLYWGQPGENLRKFHTPRRLTDQVVQGWRWEIRQQGWNPARIRELAAAVPCSYDAAAMAIGGATHQHLNVTCPPATRPRGRVPLPAVKPRKVSAADRDRIMFRLRRGERPMLVAKDYPQLKISYIRTLGTLARRGK